jgi:hypothetical protein
MFKDHDIAADKPLIAGSAKTNDKKPKPDLV